MNLRDELRSEITLRTALRDVLDVARDLALDETQAVIINEQRNRANTVIEVLVAALDEL